MDENREKSRTTGSNEKTRFLEEKRERSNRAKIDLELTKRTSRETMHPRDVFDERHDFLRTNLFFSPFVSQYRADWMIDRQI